MFRIALASYSGNLRKGLFDKVINLIIKLLEFDLNGNGEPGNTASPGV